MSRRRLFFVCSTLFWLLMMGFLFGDARRRDPTGGGDPLVSLVRATPSATNWFGIYREGRKLGYCQVSIAADAAGDAVSYRVDLYLTLVSPQEVKAQGDIVLEDPGGLISFSARARTGAQWISLTGEREEDSLLLAFDLGGGAIPPGTLFSENLPGPSESIRVPLGTGAGGWPALDRGGEEVVKVRGVLITARRYAVSSSAGEISFWIDREGSPVRADFPGGLSLVREPRSLATNPK